MNSLAYLLDDLFLGKLNDLTIKVCGGVETQ